MKNLFWLMITFAVANRAMAQTQTACGCPSNKYSSTIADTTFTLANGNKIALCGYRDTQSIKGEILYSEFVLAKCGDNKVIQTWGATDLCKLTVVNNRLQVNKIIQLPVGKGMAYEPVIYTIENITGYKPGPVSVYNHIPHYSALQIAAVIQSYNTSPNVNNDKTIALADKLFVSALSGSKQAERYLTSFKKKFTTLDGAYAESYNDLLTMLNKYKNR